MLSWHVLRAVLLCLYARVSCRVWSMKMIGYDSQGSVGNFDWARALFTSHFKFVKVNHTKHSVDYNHLEKTRFFYIALFYARFQSWLSKLVYDSILLVNSGKWTYPCRKKQQIFQILFQKIYEYVIFQKILCVEYLKTIWNEELSAVF